MKYIGPEWLLYEAESELTSKGLIRYGSRGHSTERAGHGDQISDDKQVKVCSRNDKSAHPSEAEVHLGGSGALLLCRWGKLKEIFGTWYKMNMVPNGDEPLHSLQFELDEKAAAGRDTCEFLFCLVDAGNIKQTGPSGAFIS